MKNKIHKLLDPNISKKEEDQILRAILKEKHDKELKTRWQETLSSQYGIIRSQTNQKGKSTISNYLKIFLAVAACISLLIVFQLFNTKPSTASDLAQQYLQKQEILHPGATKGSTEEDQNRIRAIQFFNNKEYVQSVSYFEKLEAPNEEDLYYHALALLLNKQYAKAIQKFDKSSLTNNRFKQELNWYQSLAYLLNNQNEEAKAKLKQIGNTDWNYQEAQKLIQQLEKK